MKLEAIARLYERALMVAIAMIPAIGIWYLSVFSASPLPVFENHGFHEMAIAVAILVGGFVSYVSWRSYCYSGEIFLRWLTVGFLAFTLIYAPHGLLTRTAHHNIWLFLLYGPVSRIAMIGCLIVGLIEYGKSAEDPGVIGGSGFWRRVFLICGAVVAAVALLAHSPIASSPWVRGAMESGAILLSVGAICVMGLRRIGSPLMLYYAVALALFAQAAVAFLLAKPWNHMWWLAHMIFAGGFFILSWGVVRALLTTRSFALAYSQEQLMRSLEERKLELQGLYRTLQTVREDERTRIARELHDGTGHLLTAMVMDLGWIDAKLPKDGSAMSSKLASVVTLSDQVVDSIRGVMEDLRPSILGELGLVAALEGFVDNFTTRTGIRCDLVTSGEETKVGDEFATDLFRIVQEALNNVVKHAKATHVTVSLTRNEDKIVLVIQDDGKGLEQIVKDERGRFGVGGMRERVSMLGGTFAVTSEHGQGVRLEAVIPTTQTILVA